MRGADILQFPMTAAPGAPATPGPRREPEADLAELQLINRLHRHLEIHTLLEQFLEEISAYLPIEGISYTVPETREAFLVGNSGRVCWASRVQYGGEYLGEIEIQSATEIRASLTGALELLAAPLHNALCHHRLKMLARTDPLTGLGNRMALDSTLATELARAQRFGRPFALLVVDIDHFKRINDNFGHSAGDQVLRTVAAQIRDCMRPYDHAFRFGGEEFVVVLSQTALAKSMQIAERLRRRIAVHCKASAKPSQKITVSIGSGEYRSAETLEELFDRADRALYAAKNQGRNRVVAAN